MPSFLISVSCDSRTKEYVQLAQLVARGPEDVLLWHPFLSLPGKHDTSLPFCFPR